MANTDVFSTEVVVKDAEGTYYKAVMRIADVRIGMSRSYRFYKRAKGKKKWEDLNHVKDDYRYRSVPYTYNDRQKFILDVVTPAADAMTELLGKDVYAYLFDKWLESMTLTTLPFLPSRLLSLHNYGQTKS